MLRKYLIQAFTNKAAEIKSLLKDDVICRKHIFEHIQMFKMYA